MIIYTCTLFSEWLSIPTTTHPIALPELIASVRFSCCWYQYLIVSSTRAGDTNLEDGEFLSLVDNSLIYCVRRSKVDHLAEENTIIHAGIKVWSRILEQGIHHTITTSISSITFSGRRWLTSLSCLRLLLIQSLKAACSSLRTMCWAPMAPGM